MRIAPFASLIFPGLLAACASELQDPRTGGFFADPGLYEYFSCEQLTGHRTYWAARLQELKALMDKAEKSTGGAFINVIAYQTDYVAAKDQLNVINATMRVKKCSTPENWGSTTAIR